jgi:AcrR family transcriptional regulator
VPKLWTETIEAHRRQVRDAILDATAELAARAGMFNVTMSQVADEVGIGRATLYKYFSSLEEILHAWHEREIASHLRLLREVGRGAEPAIVRLTSVLGKYARIQRQHTDHHENPEGRELAAFLHRDGQLAPAEQELHDMLASLLSEAADSGHIRDDVSPDELSTFCLHALGAARTLVTDAALDRLVAVTLSGVQTP